MCLLLSAFMLVLAMAFMGQRGAYYSASQNIRWATQAQALAEAGLDDFRAKLAKDVRFPPPVAPEFPEFIYSEDLTLPGATEGHYTVHANLVYQYAPYWVFRVYATGTVGDRSHPQSLHTIYAEIDNCPTSRTDASIVNLNRYQILHQQEGVASEN